MRTSKNFKDPSTAFGTMELAIPKFNASCLRPSLWNVFLLRKATATIFNHVLLLVYDVVAVTPSVYVHGIPAPVWPLIPTIFNIFAWNFAWVILMTSSRKYKAQKSSSTLTNTSKFFSLCYGQPYYIIYISSCAFSPGLKFGMDLQKRINLQYIKKSKYCTVWHLFKIKWPKSELSILVGSFCTHVSAPWKKCRGG